VHGDPTYKSVAFFQIARTEVMARWRTVTLLLLMRGIMVLTSYPDDRLVQNIIWH